MCKTRLVLLVVCMRDLDFKWLYKRYMSLWAFNGQSLDGFSQQLENSFNHCFVSIITLMYHLGQCLLNINGLRVISLHQPIPHMCTQ